MADYTLERINRLVSIGIKPEKGPMSMKRISVTEKGVNYKVEVEGSLISQIFPIDGVAIKEGLRCDKFITTSDKERGISIFLELKGRDINHAITQIESTISNPLFRPYPNKQDKSRARIVTNRGVVSTSRVEFEKAKIRFLKNYNIDLRQLSSLQPDSKIKL